MRQLLNGNAPNLFSFSENSEAGLPVQIETRLRTQSGEREREPVCWHC